MNFQHSSQAATSDLTPGASTSKKLTNPLKRILRHGIDEEEGQSVSDIAI